jgi:hypothetical protein
MALNIIVGIIESIHLLGVIIQSRCSPHPNGEVVICAPVFHVQKIWSCFNKLKGNVAYKNLDFEGLIIGVTTF